MIKFILFDEYSPEESLMKVHRLNCGHIHPFSLAHPKSIQKFALLEAFIRSQLERPIVASCLSMMQSWGQNWDFQINRVDWNNELKTLQELKQIPCQCLLIETANKLILVDSGLGKDINRAVPYELQRLFLGISAEGMSAPEQIEALGHDPEDVQDIVVTHMDYDHIGGLHHFPRAKVHLQKREWEMVQSSKGPIEKSRFIPRLWAHGVNWNFIEQGGEKWENFEEVQSLPQISTEEILLVPTPGHTLGHQAIAIPQSKILFCGDAYLHRSQLTLPKGSESLVIKAYNHLFASNLEQFNQSLESIKNFIAHNSNWEVYGSHDFAQDS